MIDLPDSSGSLLLATDNEGPNDSGDVVVKREADKAGMDVFIHAVGILFASYRYHVAALLESHRATLEERLQARLDVSGSSQNIVNKYGINQIEGIAADIVRASGGGSIQVNIDFHASAFAEQVEAYLGLQTVEDAA